MFLPVTHRSIIYKCNAEEWTKKTPGGKNLRFYVSLCKIELNSEYV